MFPGGTLPSRLQSETLKSKLARFSQGLGFRAFFKGAIEELLRTSIRAFTHRLQCRVRVWRSSCGTAGMFFRFLEQIVGRVIQFVSHSG